MKKRIFIISLVVIMMISMAACGKKETDTATISKKDNRTVMEMLKDMSGTDAAKENPEIVKEEAAEVKEEKSQIKEEKEKPQINAETKNPDTQTQAADTQTQVPDVQTQAPDTPAPVQDTSKEPVILTPENAQVYEAYRDTIDFAIENFVPDMLNTVTLRAGETHKPFAVQGWGTGSICYSSNENVATIAQGGQLTAVAPGTAYIVVMSGISPSMNFVTLYTVI